MLQDNLIVLPLHLERVGPLWVVWIKHGPLLRRIHSHIDFAVTELEVELEVDVLVFIFCFHKVAHAQATNRIGL